MEFVKKKLRKPDLSEKKTFHIKCVNHNKMKYMRQNSTLQPFDGFLSAMTIVYIGPVDVLEFEY